VLIIIGALFNRMGPVLWVIAVLSTLTVIHRIRYTQQQLALIEPPPVPVRPDPLKFEEIVG
jgi:CDP-diacylglycerol--glycerol-3-phosphate 3-phosphatidyltransferase